MKVEIEQFNPCEDALEFRKQFTSFEDAWNNCRRGDWMLWLAKRLDVDLKTFEYMVFNREPFTITKAKACEVEATHDELVYAAYCAASADAVVADADYARKVLTDEVFNKIKQICNQLK